MIKTQNLTHPLNPPPQGRGKLFRHCEILRSRIVAIQIKLSF
ncbi:hypothetical protein [Helicobacter sp. 23-1045]